MAEQKFMKQVEGYGKDDANNYKAESEIMVTITLNEYRALVTCMASRDVQIHKAEEDRYVRNEENNRLKKENAELKAEMYELKKQLDNVTDEEEK